MKKLFIVWLGVMVGLHAAQPRVIAFAQDTMANDFRKAQVFEVRDAVQSLPQVKFTYSDAEGKTALLIAQIEKFIVQKVDVLIVGTNDAKAVVPVVAKAYQNGIAVIILDRGIDGDQYTTFIHSDNIKIGAIGGEYIAKQLNGKGKVLLFEGIQTADVTHLRTQGFMEVMAKYPAIKVIKRTGNYLRKDAIIETEKLLEEGIRVDAIFSESDSMLSGVRTVYYRYGIAPSSVIMVGCDYTSEAQSAILKGEQTGSVLFPLGGNESVEIAQKIFAGLRVPKDLVIPVKLVTRENATIVKPIF
ncbi:MAG: LacI family transcriptional regulator [Sulfuricurvum sp. PC08-66]|nr:MAG: LacI family transcriptional regulator [Sulfuricurvum sp. PC08-66]